jgi:hypothetical protein
MRKSLRYLRTTWTVFCGIACLLIIAFWVRSYWWGDSYKSQVNQTWFGCSDLRGCIVLTCFDATERTDLKGGYSWGPASGQRLGDDISEPFFGFAAKNVTHGMAIVLPSWFLVAMCFGCAVAPWFSWRRFSLRKLLITITLIAMVLGLSVWLSQ